MGMMSWALCCSQLISPSQPSFTRLLGSGGHIFQGREDLPRLMDRTKDEPRMALPGHRDE